MAFLISYAMSFVKTAYHWGGDDPMGGFDCSGFVQEILMAADVIKRLTPKMSAQSIFDYLLQNGGSQGTFGAGSIAFFGPDAKSIHHIGFCIDSNYMIHAGSGDSTTVSVERAEVQNAFVRMDSIRYRKDFLCVVKPAYRIPV